MRNLDDLFVPCSSSHCIHHVISTADNSWTPLCFPYFSLKKHRFSHLACFAQDRPRIIGVSGISILHPWRNGLMPWMKPSGNLLAKIADLGRFTVLDGDPVRYVNVY
jgi:hypothetical protein